MNKEKNIDKIRVRGARTHNLKNIDMEMPRNKMVVFTGLSGSGKSSLAFDTIFAEGQRRYVESLSAYARQFLNQMPKPDVDEIVGLSPAISIDQKSRSNNPRSTVATITEIYDYLRILYARIGHPHCLVCGEKIQKLSNEEIKNFILEKIATHKTAFKKNMSKVNSDIEKKNKSKLGKAVEKVTTINEQQEFVEIFAPLVTGRKGEYYQLLYDLLGKGYSHVLIDGERKSLREKIILSKTKRHSIDVMVDSISMLDFINDQKSAEERLGEDLEKALTESDGKVKIMFRNMASD